MDKCFLKFFKSALFLCLYCGSLSAAQWARVSSPKAVLFADPAMSSPIGYFKKGQKIRVGEVPRNKGRVLPTVYKKKIVYVRIVDLETSKDLRLIRTATERMKDREVKEAMRETRLGIGAAVYGASASSFNSVGEKKESESLFLGGVGLNGASYNLERDYHYIVNMEYLSGSKAKAHLSLILMGIGASYELIKLDHFRLGAYAAFEAAPWAQYEVDSLFKVNGYGLGASSGLEGDLRITKKWSFSAFAGYRYLKLLGFNLPGATSEYKIQDDFSPSLHGLALSGALSYSW